MLIQWISGTYSHKNTISFPCSFSNIYSITSGGKGADANAWALGIVNTLTNTNFIVSLYNAGGNTVSNRYIYFICIGN